jgi:hypothetical protein
MKALSIRQPWVHSILHLGKRIENRTWPTSFRGHVLLHAAKGMTRDGYNEAAALICRASGRPTLPFAAFKASAVFGAIVGSARVVDCVRNDDVPRLEKNDWAFDGQYGFVLDEVEPFDVSVPWRGALGLFMVDDEAFAKALKEARNSAMI